MENEGWTASHVCHHSAPVDFLFDRFSAEDFSHPRHDVSEGRFGKTGSLEIPVIDEIRIDAYLQPAETFDMARYISGDGVQSQRSIGMIQSQLWKARCTSAFAATLVGAMGLSLLGAQARAESAMLVGTWAGNGNINFSSGKNEKARCRAHFAKTGARSYEMSATCATSSAKVDQTAELTKVGADSYVGSFYNQEYNTGGRIRITVSGRTGSVNLSGEAGTAYFRLRKY
jgi:hypothetical protein